MAMLYPAPRGGFGTRQFDWRIHTFVGYEGFKYPCGGYSMGPNTDIKAGQLIPVRFWTSEMRDADRLPKKSIDEARHGGGMCEFSLSYDGGKSFHVIATYTKTCPDAAYEWPVRIPDNTIQLYDFKGHKQKVTFPGDGNSHHRGPGPMASEVKTASGRKTI
ncbi:hypothetical protein BGZ70_006987 [Mortierella alpina]|uniref:Uncharacterized protein n=1 Tax=Mortierella alpina TaxID=64518 RepID=A0A9P6J713_MORAP|nr:hypothetical protein BGZ70_006987 [Mortierella alpina]